MGKIIEKFQIERLNLDEVVLAKNWACQEDERLGLNDAECFYQIDPQGFFAGKLNGEIIALESKVIYDENFAFCGLCIVDKNYHDQDYELQLTSDTGYIGTRNMGIDVGLNRVDTYASLGYKLAHHNACYVLENKHLTPKFNACFTDLEMVPFTHLVQYDRQYFPALRPGFLSTWMMQTTAFSLGYVENRQLKGYGVIRKCFKGYKIGPLFADSSGIAEKIFSQLAEYARGASLYLDIPENNSLAIELVKKLGMSKVFSTARMYSQDLPQVATQGIYGL